MAQADVAKTMDASGKEQPTTREELYRARRVPNLLVALGLVAFIVAVFIVTVTVLGASVLDRPL